MYSNAYLFQIKFVKTLIYIFNVKRTATFIFKLNLLSHEHICMDLVDYITYGINSI